MEFAALARSVSSLISAGQFCRSQVFIFMLKLCDCLRQAAKHGRSDLSVDIRVPETPLPFISIQAVTGMVYSNANPAWPSNGNGNAFVLPVRRSKRQTDLVITVWDGSESLEEAIPVGKVHVNLQQFMNFPSLPPGKDTKDDAPPRKPLFFDLSSPAHLFLRACRGSPGPLRQWSITRKRRH